MAELTALLRKGTHPGVKNLASLNSSINREGQRSNKDRLETECEQRTKVGADAHKMCGDLARGFSVHVFGCCRQVRNPILHRAVERKCASCTGLDFALL